MLASVLAHVDELGGFFAGSNGGVKDGVRLAHDRNHGAVCGRARVNIEELNSVDGFDDSSDFFDDGKVAAFGKVGDTLE